MKTLRSFFCVSITTFFYFRPFNKDVTFIFISDVEFDIFAIH